MRRAIFLSVALLYAPLTHGQVADQSCSTVVAMVANPYATPQIRDALQEAARNKGCLQPTTSRAAASPQPQDFKERGYCLSILVALSTPEMTSQAGELQQLANQARAHHCDKCVDKIGCKAPPDRN